MQRDNDDRVSEQIWQTIRESYRFFNQRREVYVPHVADDVAKRLKLPTANLFSVRLCQLQLRQMVRGYCRHFIDPVRRLKEQDPDQQELFSTELQDRYPVSRKGIQVYIPIDGLTDSEGAALVRKLRKHGGGLVAHADALARYLKHRKAA